MLPLDLAKVIIAYLPLKKLQLWQESNPNLFTNQFNNQWFKYKYGLSIVDLTKDINDDVKTFLTPFELCSYLAMNMGDIGYLGQFYLPIDVILAYCIQAKDLELLNYYLIRFINQNGRLHQINSGFINFVNNNSAVVLTYLAEQYFPPALKLLTDFKLIFYKTMIRDISMTDELWDSYYYLFNGDIDQMEDLSKFNFLSQIDINFFMRKVNDVGIITKKLIHNANKLLLLVDNNSNLDYVKILKILTNQDVDITTFIVAKSYIIKPNYNFLSLAFSVLNKPICDKVYIFILDMVLRLILINYILVYQK